MSYTRYYTDVDAGDHTIKQATRMESRTPVVSVIQKLSVGNGITCRYRSQFRLRRLADGGPGFEAFLRSRVVKKRSTACPPLWYSQRMVVVIDHEAFGPHSTYHTSSSRNTGYSQVWVWFSKRTVAWTAFGVTWRSLSYATLGLEATLPSRFTMKCRWTKTAVS